MKKSIYILSWIFVSIVCQAQSNLSLLMCNDAPKINYILNDDFSTSQCGVEWTCASSWSIADGKATTDNINFNQFQNTSAILTGGTTYVLEMDQIMPAGGYLSNYFTFALFDIGITTNLLGSYQTQFGGLAGDSTYIFEFTPLANSNGITIYSNGGTTSSWSIDAIRIYVKP